MDSIRKEFELWAESRGLDLYCSRKDLYEDTETLWAWSAWKASRASLAVTLPSRADTGVDCGGWPLDSGSHRVNGTIDKCKDAIHAAGIRTK